MSGTYRHLRSWIVTWLLRQHKPCWTPTPCGQCAIRLSMERWRAGFQRGRQSVTLCILQLNVGFFATCCWHFATSEIYWTSIADPRFKCLRGAVFDFFLVRVVCWTLVGLVASICWKNSALEKRNKSRLQGKGPMCFGEMSLLAEFDSLLLTSQPWRSRCFQNVCLFFRRSLDDVDWMFIFDTLLLELRWCSPFLIYLVTHYVSYVCMLFLASWLLVHPVRKTSYRSYSCSVSLCDPSGYEGGVIQFFRGFGIKDRWHQWIREV